MIPRCMFADLGKHNVEWHSLDASWDRINVAESVKNGLLSSLTILMAFRVSGCASYTAACPNR
jgi:hypothetical protein